jgi:hypothetical protein
VYALLARDSGGITVASAKDGTPWVFETKEDAEAYALLNFIWHYSIATVIGNPVITNKDITGGEPWTK